MDRSTIISLILCLFMIYILYDHMYYGTMNSSTIDCMDIKMSYLPKCDAYRLICLGQNPIRCSNHFRYPYQSHFSLIDRVFFGLHLD